jgi:hypothetical protein
MGLSTASTLTQKLGGTFKVTSVRPTNSELLIKTGTKAEFSVFVVSNTACSKFEDLMKEYAP